MPYALIPLVTSIVLGAYHVAVADASRRSRIAVSAVVLGSLLIWWRYPQWLVAATLLQVAASIYVLLHIRLRESAG